MFLFDKGDFLSLAEKGRIAPLVWVEELEERNPFALLKALTADARPPYGLLESAGGNPLLARYSILACSPYLIFRSKDGKNLVWNPAGDSCEASTPHPFLALKDLMHKYSPGQAVPLDLPFWGGAMGFVSYDAARHLEKLPCFSQDDLLIPDMAFFFPALVLVLDHQKSLLYAVVNQVVSDDAHSSYQAAQQTMSEVLSLLGKGGDRHDSVCSFPKVEVIPNLSQARFEAMVRRTLEYIFAGDVYQVNLSQRLRVPFRQNPASLYLRLRSINPSPFAAYLDLGDLQLISSSPERLIMLRGSRASTRPIAGTRPRGADTGEEDWLSEHLLLDEKERAEHVMLVDLERNDLGRVCRYGSVEPSELMVLEKYSHVIHIVSNIEGELSQGKDMFDLIQAMFPGGTITGCPKVRCMEIIEELEPVRRGPYTGSIGYFGFNGEMDMNIVIRTILLKEGSAYAQVGAGIVADSQPRREYFETFHKAEAMLRALNATRYPLYSETKKVFL